MKVNIEKKYLKQIKKIIKNFNKNKKLKFFFFGSVLNQKRTKIGDIDIAVMGETKNISFSELKEGFEESTLPFKVDIIDLNEASEEFKNNVLNNKILWIIR